MRSFVIAIAAYIIAYSGIMQKKYNSADTAGFEAADAFLWLTGEEWKDWVFNDVKKCL